MKGNRIAISLIVPLALFSTLSLFDNVEAQTNSTATNQTTTSSQQQLQQPQNQNANLTAQALMKTDIVELKNTLMNAKLALIDGNIKQALQDVINVQTQLLLLEPSLSTKFLNNIHKAIGAIDKSDIDKSLDILTNIQVSILKAENLILKNIAANPESETIQPVDTSKSEVPTPEPEKIQQLETFKNVVAIPPPQDMYQSDNFESNTNADDFHGYE